MDLPLHPPSPSVIDRIVELALQEDLGRGDITTEACVASEIQGQAHLAARERLVWCGLPIVEAVYRMVDPSVSVSATAAEGASLEPGDVALEIAGPAMSILRGERVALNFVQRLSGTATMAHQLMAEIPKGSKCRIVDTRKTTPGLRAFERYAVRCGGAFNHREDLSSAVLIKDNHIAAAGGVKAAIDRARQYAPHTSRIECEVDTMEQLQVALDAGADIVLLDNFTNEQVAKGVELVAGRAIVEVSGGITRERIRALAEAGAQVISVGALTHSAPAADLGLDWA